MYITSKDQMRELFKEFADVYAINIQEQIEKALIAKETNINMSAQECSEYLNQCVRTTYAQILNGKITAERVGNKYIIPKNQFTK